MNRALFFTGAVCVGMSFFLSGCDKPISAKESADIGPVATAVVPDTDANHFKVDHPEQFPLTTAGDHAATTDVSATGVVSPDVSRQVPVPSLATGRVEEINARLGDTVQKGQLLFKVRSTDIAGAYADYRKAVKNEQLAVENQRLAATQLARAKLLYDDGAIAKSNYEVAQNAQVTAQTALETARIDVETTTERLKLLGSDPAHPTGVIDVYAPVSGVITDQQITNSAGVQALTPPNPFTISDLSRVWIVCDVFENDLAAVRVGESADIRVNAYPNQILRGRVANIGPVLDPANHTAKVRIEVENAGLLRFGMFVSATFHGMDTHRDATVPATAVLHLHDHDWVYIPAAGGTFQRVEVVAGAMLPGDLQEIVSGVKPGQQVVTRALIFQNTTEQ